MFMPAVFHENLFDDFFDPFWNDGALERAMNREERETFGKRGANMMKTDVKQTADGNYDVAVDLPGCKKEDVQMELNDGYLTIQAVRSHSNDEKDKEGRYLRRETFSGTCARSFYVGDAVKKEDIHAKFEDGILHVTLPAPQQQKALPVNPNLIEIEKRLCTGVKYRCIGLAPGELPKGSPGAFCVPASFRQGRAWCDPDGIGQESGPAPSSPTFPTVFSDASYQNLHSIFMICNFIP